MDKGLPRQDLHDLLIEQAHPFGSGRRALSNIESLWRGEAAAVFAVLRPDSAGGLLCDWLKAMTAARLADWISERGTPAVPVLWIDSGHGADGHALSWGRAISDVLQACGIILFDAIPAQRFAPVIQSAESITKRLERNCAEAEKRLGSAGYSPAITEGAFVHPDETAMGRRESEPATPFWLPYLVLPIAACIADESEIHRFACEQAMFAEIHREPPVIWPRMSATIVDERSRKMLARHRLELADLYAGAGNLIEKLTQSDAIAATGEKIDGLRAAIEATLSELGRLVPAGDTLQGGLRNSRRRMLYQVEKLKNAFCEGQRRRRDLIGRQLPQLCDALAPRGGLQERELAGIHLMERFSAGLPQLLCAGLDPWKFEHQLFFL